jgi:hypothetical protein
MRTSLSPKRMREPSGMGVTRLPGSRLPSGGMGAGVGAVRGQQR